MLGLESTCDGNIEYACVWFDQQLFGSGHPCPQDKLVRRNAGRLPEHLREVGGTQIYLLRHLHQTHVLIEVFVNKAGHAAELRWGETSAISV